LESQAKTIAAQHSFPDGWKCVHMHARLSSPSQPQHLLSPPAQQERRSGAELSSGTACPLKVSADCACQGQRCKPCAPSALSHLAPSFLISLSNRGCAAKRR